MSLIRHCIIDTTTNLVVNIIEYETEQSGVPNGLEDTLLVMPSVDGEIGGTYANGVITNPPVIVDIPALLPPTPEELMAQLNAIQAQIAALQGTK